jgi:hypothetical protein
MQLIEKPAGQTDLAEVGRVTRQELQQLLRHCDELNQRIVVLRRTLRAVLGDEVAARDPETFAAVRLTPRKRDGLTHICRCVLNQAPLPLTAIEITEAIRRASPTELRKHRDPLKSVTAVLRNLLEYGEANNTFNDEGRRTWFAVRKPPGS